MTYGLVLPFATGPFFSMANTNFVVLLGFLIFVGILIYAKVPGRITEMLDGRAALISAELNEARNLREEAQTMLASYERKQKEVADQVAGIVSSAKAEAETAASEAHEDLKKTMERRLQAAIEQIGSAEKAAVREVKDRAVSVAIAAAAKVIEENLDAAKSSDLVSASIKDASEKLH